MKYLTWFNLLLSVASVVAYFATDYKIFSYGFLVGWMLYTDVRSMMASHKRFAWAR